MIAALTTTNGIARINCDTPIALEVEGIKFVIGRNTENGKLTLRIDEKESEKDNVTYWKLLYEGESR